jgi:glutamyl-tRNA reductase
MTVLNLVGLSHHSAPVELRERVALTGGDAAQLARELAEPEAVVLSTCNRTEIYLAAADFAPADAALERLAGRNLEGALYRLTDEAAALHLFRVAAGLDSLVPGEGEILGQVRTAFEAGAAGPVLDHVFRQAISVGKKVRSETAIGESPASVSSAAAALAQQVFGELQGRRVLLVGAGRTGELAASSLAARGAQIAFVANRTAERAEELARRFGGAALSLDEVPARIGEVDVILTCTGAAGFVIRREDVEGVKRDPLFFIDIAVPRDVDPRVNHVDGCYLYDIDDLEAVVAETLAGRRREAIKAEALVAAEAERFHEWHASLEVVPAIASLRARAEEIRRAEVDKLNGLGEDERRTIETVTTQILNKLLHLPTVRMKQAAAAEGPGYAEALRHLFDLGEDERR